MSSLISPARDVVPENTGALVAAFDEDFLLRVQRKAALERYFALKSGRERPGRYWRFDLDALDLSGVRVRPDATAPQLPSIEARGIVVCDLATAKRSHAALFERSFGKAVNAQTGKFAALTTAFVVGGAFVYVPPDTCVDEPVVVRYACSDGALFPYTLVLAERGAQVTILEHVEATESNPFVCGVAEIVTEEGADVTYASAQTLPSDARVIFTRVARAGRNAKIQWAAAELGAGLSVSSLDVIIDQPGVEAQIAGLFFPRDDQHVDMISTVEHNVGDSRSDTLVKSAATGNGQARYLGNIRIAPHAQGSAATLRDDALLLSPKAHIDSVPALEIGANDVKAYHGATVGALDEDVLFYMTSRGIARTDAERMVALGFFEPALDRFPGEALRKRLREALEAKVR